MTLVNVFTYESMSNGHKRCHAAMCANADMHLRCYHRQHAETGSVLLQDRQEQKLLICI